MVNLFSITIFFPHFFSQGLVLTFLWRTYVSYFFTVGSDFFHLFPTIISSSFFSSTIISLFFVFPIIISSSFFFILYVSIASFSHIAATVTWSFSHWYSCQCSQFEEHSSPTSRLTWLCIFLLMCRPVCPEASFILLLRQPHGQHLAGKHGLPCVGESKEGFKEREKDVAKILHRSSLRNKKR